VSLSDALADKANQQNRGTVEVGPDGGEFKNATVQGRLDGDWSRVFDMFGLDPNEFEVIDDTVRMSTWQQSKRTDSGDRDVAQLYSYSARFRRVTREMVSPETLLQWRKALLKSKFPGNRDYGTASSHTSGTYVALVADPQLGKKGTAEAIENWKRGLTGHIEQARRLGVEGFHIAFMGDEVEGFANNYTNQSATIEMNHSQQLETDFDMRVWSVKEALALGVPVSVSSVISNHGEWTRNGGKDPVTSRGDNSSTHTARLVQKLFAELEQYGIPHVEWYIGDGRPAVTITLSGVKCYFTHGYVEKGRGASTELRAKGAIERQVLGNTDTLGDIRLWFWAHYHHFYSNEFEGRTLFGCPALEAERSSEWMSEQFGVWSPPGMLGVVVTDQVDRGWEHCNVY
jgi:hypothetical protein